MSDFQVLKVFINNGSLLESNFEFDFVTKLNTVPGKNDSGINRIFNSIYKHDLMAITGINASGKTITLKTIYAVMDFYLSGTGLNSIIDTVSECFFEPKLIFGIFFRANDYLYKVETTIDKDIKLIKAPWFVLDETIWKKKITSKTNRVNLYKDYNRFLNRKELSEDLKNYLSKDISIIIGLKIKFTMIHSFYITDYNFISDVGFLTHDKMIPEAFVKYLDPNIEYIRRDEENEDIFIIKMVNENEPRKTERFKISQLLSSGTIKGISLFPWISIILNTGGCIFIDEIELHLNRAIVESIMRLFSDLTINKYHATLVFTTHYPELLDRFDRNDSIYVTHKNKQGNIMIFNYSDKLKRNDLKKSDVYSSDYLRLGTAPSLSRYKAFVKEMQTMMEADSVNE